MFALLWIGAPENEGSPDSGISQVMSPGFLGDFLIASLVLVMLLMRRHGRQSICLFSVLTAGLLATGGRSIRLGCGGL
jgi:hypothetical protein